MPRVWRDAAAVRTIVASVKIFRPNHFYEIGSLLYIYVRTKTSECRDHKVERLALFRVPVLQGVSLHVIAGHSFSWLASTSGPHPLEGCAVPLSVFVGENPRIAIHLDLMSPRGMRDTDRRPL